jgi:signal transduction histidine kinase
VTRARARAWPWAAAAAIVALLVSAGALEATAGSHRDSWGEIAASIAAVLVCGAIGLLLVLQRPRNVIGWLLLANSALVALSGFAAAYAINALLAHPGSLPGGRLAALWDTACWPTLFVGLIAVAFVFPDGHLPSPRWRRVVVAAALSFLLLQISVLFSSDPLDPPFNHISRPLPELSGAVIGPLFLLGFLGSFAGLVAAAVAVRTRLRTAEGAARQQIRWLAYAAALIPAIVVVCLAEGAITDDPGAATFVALLTVELAIPVAVGIAVSRYRLYEIDRLINRTLVYGALSALLAASFILVTLVVGVAAGGESTLATAIATLAVALAFRPLRSRLQTVVDRRFDRARYEGMTRIDRFLEQLRLGQTAPEEVGRVLAEALGDPSLTLFYWLPRSEVYADAAGRPVPELPPEPTARTPVRRGELPLGMLVHDPRLSVRPDLLDEAIVRAGLAIEIARLRVEVRRQLAQVEESRARIVAATHEERRRLERDLHDGAQQHLVSLGLELRHLQHEMPPTSGAARESLDAVVDGLAQAIDELRELAHGVRPATLDQGLGPALRELGARSSVPTEVIATEERFDSQLEAAAYFVASEALANSIKHSHGSRVVVEANRMNGSLMLSVSDDGSGGASLEDGSGLAGLADRVAALGGRLELQSTEGYGTCVTAELPCE